MKHRVQRILEIKDQLSELPDLMDGEERIVSSRDAVALLADVLGELQKKGYTTETISRLLKEQGMELSLSTLRRYMKDVTSRTGKTPRNKSSSTTEPKTKKKSSHFSTPPSRTGATTEHSTNSGGFQVRKDSEEL